MRRFIDEPGWTSYRDEVLVEQDPRSDARYDEGPGARAEDAAGRALEVEVESADQRAARLAKLRDAINAGSYRIPAEAVATRVMQHMSTQPAPEEAPVEMAHAPSRDGIARIAVLRKQVRRSGS